MQNETVAKLIKIRNPHGVDHTFTGRWADNSDIWNTKGPDGRTYAQQANITIADDGVLIFEISEFKLAFSSFWIGFAKDDWITSFYD